VNLYRYTVCSYAHHNAKVRELFGCWGGRAPVFWLSVGCWFMNPEF
jgi:hypothetical protein